MDAIMALIYIIFLETFYEKIKKELIFFTVFYISHKNCIKIFLKLFINKCPKVIC